MNWNIVDYEGSVYTEENSSYNSNTTVKRELSEYSPSPTPTPSPLSSPSVSPETTITPMMLLKLNESLESFPGIEERDSPIIETAEPILQAEPIIETAETTAETTAEPILHAETTAETTAEPILQAEPIIEPTVIDSRQFINRPMIKYVLVKGNLKYLINKIFLRSVLAMIIIGSVSDNENYTMGMFSGMVISLAIGRFSI
jgi:hypothetical protein